MKGVKKPSVREFLRIIWTHWSARMSGGVGLVLTALGFLVDVQSLQVAFTVSGVVCVIVSAYQAWKVEREQLCALTEKRPRLVLSAEKVMHGARRVTRIIVRNDGEVSARRVQLQSLVGVTVRFEFFEMDHLPPGESKPFEVSSNAVNDLAYILAAMQQEKMTGDLYEMFMPKSRGGPIPAPEPTSRDVIQQPATHEERLTLSYEGEPGRSYEEPFVAVIDMQSRRVNIRAASEGTYG